MRDVQRRLRCGAVLFFSERWEYDAGIMAPGRREVAWALHDLPVRPGDTERLMGVRDGWTSWRLRECRLPDGPATLLSGVWVSPAEAERLISGEHPMAVLLPPLYARPLSLEELMAR